MSTLLFLQSYICMSALTCAYIQKSCRPHRWQNNSSLMCLTPQLVYYSIAGEQRRLTLAETGWNRADILFSVLLSIIHHDMFICLCLFTCLVSIHLHPASHPLSHLPPCSFLHLCNAFISVTPIFYLQWVAMPFQSLGSYLSRWAVSVCPSIFLSLCIWAKRPRPPCWQPFSIWLYFGHGALTETLEGLSGKKTLRGETERALKRLWIPVRSPLLTGSSSLLACSQRLRWMGGIVGMDGSQLERQPWAATLAKNTSKG